MAELETVKSMVVRGRLKDRDRIGVRVDWVVNKYKVANHLHFDIGEEHFVCRLLEDMIAAEAAMDRLYVIRTSLTKERMGRAEEVRNYQQLSYVEQAIRSLKSIDLKVRPI